MPCTGTAVPYHDSFQAKVLHNIFTEFYVPVGIYEVKIMTLTTESRYMLDFTVQDNLFTYLISDVI